MTGTEEMDLLLSDKEIKVNGKRVVIHKFPMLSGIRLTARISKLVTKAMSSDDNMQSVDVAIRALMANGSTEEETRGFRLYGIRVLLDLIGNDLVDIISDVIIKSTNLTDEEAEQIDLEEGFDLLVDIYEVNKGFFMKFIKKLQTLTQTEESKKENEKTKE